MINLYLQAGDYAILSLTLPIFKLHQIKVAQVVAFVMNTLSAFLNFLDCYDVEYTKIYGQHEYVYRRWNDKYKTDNNQHKAL
ncbi:hypothetical protein KDD93_07085 [Campylobacter sp. faydin G-24]|uniref:Uncharacterized protein n=1 Tax=Campylobacter anatolicus TaxID=2829105 RepID=A0ABS5HJ83_9BACT|nr:hypothetical protein [Campylobacter anatolicus]MBR8464325.1 hypothetical protein [Campylobacter anatolicus]